MQHIHSHQSWIGLVAIWLPRPNQPADILAKLPTLKTQSGSTWVVGKNPATLTASLSSTAFHLRIELQQTTLFDQNLFDSRYKVKSLKPEDTGTGAWLVLLSASSSDSAASKIPLPSYCFKFNEKEAGASFQNLLHAAKHVASEPLPCPSPPESQPLQGQAPGDTELQDQIGQHAPLHSAQLDFSKSDMKEAVKRFLLDPDFQDLVSQVESVWDEVEAELMQQHGADEVQTHPV